MKKSHYITTALLAGMLSLSACDNMNNTQQRTLSGAGIGAATGAVIGAATGGHVGTGAAIGAAVGGAGGYAYDKSKNGN